MNNAMIPMTLHLGLSPAMTTTKCQEVVFQTAPEYLDANPGLQDDVPALPHIDLMIEHVKPNKYTDRYVIVGSAVHNVPDAGIAKMLALCACLSASKLHEGKEGFVEQGFSAEMLAGIQGLEELTYAARDTLEQRLVSTTQLATLFEAVRELGFDFQSTQAAKPVTELPGVSNIKSTHEATMLLCRDEGADGKVYDLRVLKCVPEGEEEQPFVLAQVRVLTITMGDGKVHDVARIETMTLGHEISPWSKYDAAMVVGQACTVMLPFNNPLVIGFTYSVTEEHELAPVLMSPPEHPDYIALNDVFPLLPIKLDEETTALSMAGMQVGFTKPAWVS